MEPGDAKAESDFQLRRIGPPGSCPNVLDVMRIKIGVTSFGRGDGCNFYLDSKNLKNFISRKHAEIHTVKNEDGELDFVLHHKGLNGTFVNDIKAPPTQLLAEGDKITFGHKNGYNLKPGQYASQPNSEFQYVVC
ncbi:hypothetical protein KUTeg_001879 [Tegillarca granosa]|uniref:FHA domain-containing protein n=1 Tax=Tegillarca granosa TaxID=220873 RepID=A0ABQ9FWD1_TEGGR|nr:hypothetical protein KUTeg_001879 [Tegillarca granosa]